MYRKKYKIVLGPSWPRRTATPENVDIYFAISLPEYFEGNYLTTYPNIEDIWTPLLEYEFNGYLIKNIWLFQRIGESALLAPVSYANNYVQAYYANRLTLNSILPNRNGQRRIVYTFICFFFKYLIVFQNNFLSAIQTIILQRHGHNTHSFQREWIF